MCDHWWKRPTPKWSFGKGRSATEYRPKWQFISLFNKCLQNFHLKRPTKISGFVFYSSVDESCELLFPLPGLFSLFAPSVRAKIFLCCKLLPLILFFLKKSSISLQHFMCQISIHLFGIRRVQSTWTKFPPSPKTTQMPWKNTKKNNRIVIAPRPGFLRFPESLLKHDLIASSKNFQLSIVPKQRKWRGTNRQKTLLHPVLCPFKKAQRTTNRPGWEPQTSLLRPPASRAAVASFMSPVWIECLDIASGAWDVFHGFTML